MAFIIRTMRFISLMYFSLSISDVHAMRFVQLLAASVASVNNVQATVDSLGLAALHEQPVTPTEKHILSRRLWGAKTSQEVESLVAQRADVNSDDKEGDTALHYAAFAGNSAVVAELLKRGARVNVYSDEHGTALMVAATQGHWNIAKELVVAGADPYASNYDGVTVFDMMPDEDSAKKMREIASGELLGNARVVCK